MTTDRVPCPFCDSDQVERDGALYVCTCCSRCWLGTQPTPKKAPRL